MQIFNCHTHIFTNKIVPEHFVPFLTRILSKRWISRKIGRFLNGLLPDSSDDIFDRWAAFLNIGNYRSQLEIFEFLRGFYPDSTVFVVNSMDMEFMDAGKVKQGFTSQLDELAEIKKKYPDNILPFIAADPRRQGIVDIVKKYVEEYNFAGIKLYPPLGYYPFDSRLDKTYEYAQAQGLPVISHCSPAGPVSYRGEVTGEMLGKESPALKKNYENKCDYFTDPVNYELVIKKFPKLKICLAHFGGNKSMKDYLATSWQKDNEEGWFSIIRNMVIKYDNLYADISYTMYEKDLLPIISVVLKDEKVRGKVLFGSDFYMLENADSERSFSINVRWALGEEDYAQIANKNPREFLKISVK